MSTETELQLLKYEAAIAFVEERRENLQRSRAGYARLFLSLLLLPFVGLVFGRWVFAGALITGLEMLAFGWPLIRSRAREYEDELRELRATLDGLRAQEA